MSRQCFRNIAILSQIIQKRSVHVLHVAIGIENSVLKASLFLKVTDKHLQYSSYNPYQLTKGFAIVRPFVVIGYLQTHSRIIH